MATTIRCFKDLKVWTVGMQLASDCYRLTLRFPKDERYGLVAQIRRAAISIPANVAEGHGRLHRADYLRFVSIAIGSLRELETELLLARRLGYVREQDHRRLLGAADELGRMLGSLARRLRSTPLTPSP